jgi:hypothetical protein
VQATATPNYNLFGLGIVSGGTGYNVGNVLTIVGGTFTDQLQVSVTTVSSGVITSVSVITGTFGIYTQIPPSNPATVTGGTGTGATFNLTWNFRAITIDSAGSGYVEQPTITFSGGGGSGAAAYATVGSTPTIKSTASALNFATASGLQLQVADTFGGTVANANFFIQGRTSASPVIQVVGSDTNLGAVFTTKGTGVYQFFTNGAAQEQFRIAHTASAVNYVQATGAVTGGNPVISAQGSDTNVGLAFLNKGSSAFGFRNDATASALGLELADNTTVDKTVYIDFHSSASTDFDYRLSRNPGVNGNAVYQIAGTGSHVFYTGTTANQLTAVHTASAVNWLQVSGAATGGNPYVSAQGSDTNVSLTLSTKGTGGFQFAANGNSVFTGNGGTHFRVRTDLASATGFWEVFGTTGGPIFRSTATTGLIQTSGGTLFLQTDTSGTTQLAVAHTASAVNYVQVNGATTGNRPTISAQGSDANVALALSAKAGGNMFFTASSFFDFALSGGTQFRTTNTASAVNYIQLTGSATGGATFMSSAGSDTNIPLSVASKGTGILYLGGGQTRIASNGSNSLIVGGPSGAVNYVAINSSATGITPSFLARGGDANVGLTFGAFNDANIDFYASGDPNSGTGRLQLRVAPTASAVNYVQVTGASTGNTPEVSAKGSDTNISLLAITKGSGSFVVFGNLGYQFVVASPASVVNYVQAKGGATGFGAVLSAQGSDTNIPLVVQPKGTGALQAQQTDSTATGGNARGAYSVDFQRDRDAATKVASGTYSVLAGGQNNTASGAYAFIGGGFGNVASGAATTLISGSGNTATGPYSGGLAGFLNTISGYFSFVGAGVSNTTTSSSAVTTQSATMNGTTAVTLSGSNASIRVGQFILGTSIEFGTYVSAISGTSLTLSKVASGSSTSTLTFYTPHGVVVGGGNNQATGSYSFIGGGGDAGVSANRNVASGDWSVVCGGHKNTASGVASFVGGGGIAPPFGSFPNTASQTGASVVGGFSNTASNQGTFIGGGYNNTASGVYSAILGGNAGTTRTITGNHVFPACSEPISGALGVSQAALLVLAVQTTDATATVLRSTAAAASTTNQVILPNNSAYFFTGEVVAGVTGGGNTKGWTIEGVIKRGANAASTALVGTPTVTSTYADAGASTWVIAVTADTTNGGLAVTFTGQASTTIRTVAQIRTTEMTF